MTRVYVKTYSNFEITGNDFGVVSSENMHRIMFSPDGTHCLWLYQLPDGCLCIANNGDIQFGFTVSRGRKVVATVTCAANGSALKINTNWRLTNNGIENREIHTNPDLVTSSVLNIDIGSTGIGRLDLKDNNSGYAACIFSVKELLFVKMNGNHSFPRLESCVRSEAVKLCEAAVDNPNILPKEIFEKLGKNGFEC